MAGGGIMNHGIIQCEETDLTREEEKQFEGEQSKEARKKPT
jgi:hypothetical protein